ncbi:hypothetical protein AVEN_181604-1 [Araneus ventricosus]|uniref:Mos1 transposase HTH domain-containing protein n=1 Tax=Araneus ventricosus TaxID=182803 RepID=A0A4Y2CM02_ARAVE|nr:hypothetical protein AVEN_181604-1 [Araneus ventricosus]
MTEKIAQRICIKFRQKLRDTCGETYAKLKKVYGEDCMSHTRVYELFKRFQHDRENVESNDFQNIDKCQNIQHLLSTVRENRRITIRELSEECNINYGSVQSILTDDLGVRCLFANLVPKLLSADQKENTAAFYLLECVENEENFLKMIITEDES